MSRNRKHGISSKHKVDVVITTGGRWDFLELCLDALKKQTMPANIILFDNNSDNAEKAEHQHLFENVTTKRVPSRMGFPAANNEAARMGNASYILFLNDDCILFDNAVETLVTFMDKNKDVGLCGAKLIFPLNSTSPNRPAGTIQHIGMSFNIRGDAYHPLITWNPEHPKACTTRDVLAVTGACFIIRRDLFQKLRGFDTIYGEGTYEDVDLCLRVRQAGQRVLVNADAKGYHYAGATSEKNRTNFPIMQNSMIFKQRWMGSQFLVWDEWSYY